MPRTTHRVCSPAHHVIQPAHTTPESSAGSRPGLARFDTLRPARSSEGVPAAALLLALATSPAIPAQNPSPSPAESVLTNVAQIRALSAGQAAAHRPVRIRGSVTFTEPQTCLLFLQDPTGGIYVAPGEPGATNRLDAQTGDQLELRGQTAAGQFAPIVEVLASASTITAKTLLSAAIALLALAGITLSWIWLLRRRIAHQSRHLDQQVEREASLEKRYRALLQSTYDLVATVDMTGRFLAVNPALEAAFGCPAAELLQLRITDFLTPAGRDEIQRRMAARARGEEPGAFELEIIARSGEHRFVEINSRTLIRHGQPYAVESISRDITARKAAELALEREVRTRKLAEEEAAAANRAKSDFLAAMSHEIRTPLNGVVGMLQLLQDTPLDERQRDFVDTGRRSAEALLVIINDILDFSRIEAGRLELDRAPFHAREFVEGTLELLAERAEKKRLELTGLVDDSVPAALLGDAGRLRQVLVNLLGNAIKFTERGEVTLEVDVLSAPPSGAAAVASANAVVRFTVRDTGIGLSPEAQTRLFQPFTQADRATWSQFGGTGLGLAISKHLVALMGGDIGVVSQPGQGATFWFAVPFALPAPSVPSRILPSPVPQPTLAGFRALVVDDNATNRKVLHHQLAAWGMIEIASLASAEAALACLARLADAGQSCDVALLDFHLPGLDGLSLARHIRSDPRTAAIRLVLLTSVCQRLPDADLRNAGLDAWLVKPVRQALLHSTLIRLLHRPAPSAPSPARPTQPPPTAPAPARPLRILLAEDNLVNQKVAVLQLERLGYRPAIVPEGRAVLAALDSQPYDVILMDCLMPGLDGYETARQIRRRQDAARHVWIIAMTANALLGDREKCLAAGMNDYIAKPVRNDQLQAALDRVPIRPETPLPTTSAP